MQKKTAALRAAVLQLSRKKNSGGGGGVQSVNPPVGRGLA